MIMRCLVHFKLSMTATSLHVGTWFTYGCAALACYQYKIAATAFQRCVNMDNDGAHMMSNSEDDTKGFSKLIHVYSAVIFYHGTVKDDFENRWKSLHVVLVKRSMENKLRVNNSVAKNFTDLHRELLSDMLQLAA